MNKIKKGGHEREDIPHYHNMLKLPNGKTVTLSSAEHCVSAPATNSCPEVKSWDVQELIDTIKYHLSDTDKTFTIFIGVYEDNEEQNGPITYYKIISSNGIQGVPIYTKLRDLRFGTQSLKRYVGIQPFIVVYQDELNNTKYDYLQHALNSRVAEEGEKDTNELNTRPSTPTGIGGRRIKTRRQRTRRQRTKRNKISKK